MQWTLAAAALLISGTAQARVSDAQIDACIDPQAKTADAMSACLDPLMAATDRSLNESYGAALRKLDPASGVKLRAAQRAWVAYRNADIAANHGPWVGGDWPANRLAAQRNAITALRERDDEIRRLYLIEG